MLRQHLPAEWINLAARHGLETARPLQAEGKTADAGEKFKDRQHLRLPAESADRADPAGSFGEESMPPDSTDPRMPEGQGRRREARSHPPPPVSPGPKPPLPTRQGGPWTIGVRVHPGEWRARRKRRERITAAPSAAPAGGETTTNMRLTPASQMRSMRLARSLLSRTHWPTVPSSTPNSRATHLLDRPALIARTAHARMSRVMTGLGQ